MLLLVNFCKCKEMKVSNRQRGKYPFDAKITTLSKIWLRRAPLIPEQVSKEGFFGRNRILGDP